MHIAKATISQIKEKYVYKKQQFRNTTQQYLWPY